MEVDVEVGRPGVEEERGWWAEMGEEEGVREEGREAEEEERVEAGLLLAVEGVVGGVGRVEVERGLGEMEGGLEGA